LIEGIAYVPVVHLRERQPDRLNWEDTRETVVVPAVLVAGRPNVRAMVVSDDRMHPWVMHGERVVIDPEARPGNRDMVVASDADAAVVVRWYREQADGVACLRAADGSVAPLDQYRLEGVLLSIERRAIADPED
jgi:SOS-response transcriptional repressor LexA